MTVDLSMQRFKQMPTQTHNSVLQKGQFCYNGTQSVDMVVRAFSYLRPDGSDVQYCGLVSNLIITTDLCDRCKGFL